MLNAIGQYLTVLSQVTPGIDASTTIEASKTANWAEFGLAGLVILALFGVIFYLMNEHKGERKEWKQDIGKMSENQVSAISKLTESLSKREHL